MTMTMKNEMNKKGNNWKKNLKYSLITTKCILISIDCTNNLQPPQIKPLFGTITWNPSSWCSLRIQILDRNQWMSFGGCRDWWRYLKEMPTLKKPSQVLSISSKLLSPPWNLLDIFSWDFHQNFFFISLPHLTIEQVSADEEKKVSGDDKFTCWFSSFYCWFFCFRYHVSMEWNITSNFSIVSLVVLKGQTGGWSMRLVNRSGIELQDSNICDAIKWKLNKGWWH